jgi:hypothetical protein
VKKISTSLSSKLTAVALSFGMGISALAPTIAQVSIPVKLAAATAVGGALLSPTDAQAQRNKRICALYGVASGLQAGYMMELQKDNHLPCLGYYAFVAVMFAPATLRALAQTVLEWTT